MLTSSSTKSGFLGNFRVNRRTAASASSSSSSRCIRSAWVQRPPQRARRPSSAVICTPKRPPSRSPRIPNRKTSIRSGRGRGGDPVVVGPGDRVGVLEVGIEFLDPPVAAHPAPDGAGGAEPGAVHDHRPAGFERLGGAEVIERFHVVRIAFQQGFGPAVCLLQMLAKGCHLFRGGLRAALLREEAVVPQARPPHPVAALGEPGPDGGGEVVGTGGVFREALADARVVADGLVEVVVEEELGPRRLGGGEFVRPLASGGLPTGGAGSRPTHGAGSRPTSAQGRGKENAAGDQREDSAKNHRRPGVSHATYRLNVGGCGQRSQGLCCAMRGVATGVSLPWWGAMPVGGPHRENWPALRTAVSAVAPSGIGRWCGPGVGRGRRHWRWCRASARCRSETGAPAALFRNP